MSGMSGPIHFMGTSSSSDLALSSGGSDHSLFEVAKDSIRSLNHEIYQQQSFSFLFCFSIITNIISLSKSNDKNPKIEYLKSLFDNLGAYIDSLADAEPLRFHYGRHVRFDKDWDEGNIVHDMVKKEIKLIDDNWSLYLLFNAIVFHIISQGEDEITDLSKPVFEAADVLVKSFEVLLTCPDSQFVDRVCEFDRNWQEYREKTNIYWNILYDKTSDEYQAQVVFINKLTRNTVQKLQRASTKGKKSEAAAAGEASSEEMHAADILVNLLRREKIIEVAKEDEDVSLRLSVMLIFFIKSIKDKLITDGRLSSDASLSDNHKLYLTALTLIKFLSEDSFKFEYLKYDDSFKTIFNCSQEELIDCKPIVVELVLEDGKIEELSRLLFEKFFNNKSDDEMEAFFEHHNRGLRKIYEKIHNISLRAKIPFEKFFNI